MYHGVPLFLKFWTGEFKEGCLTLQLPVKKLQCSVRLAMLRPLGKRLQNENKFSSARPRKLFLI